MRDTGKWWFVTTITCPGHSWNKASAVLPTTNHDLSQCVPARVCTRDAPCISGSVSRPLAPSSQASSSSCRRNKLMHKSCEIKYYFWIIYISSSKLYLCFTTLLIIREREREKEKVLITRFIMWTKFLSLLQLHIAKTIRQNWYLRI